MDLTRIFTVGGKPGLQKLVAQSKNGVIVESLEDSKRFNVPANGKISSLEDISVFCLDGDKPLKEVIEAIADKNKYSEVAVPSENDLRKTLSSYVDNIDEERVYTSDIKKIFKWYNLLVKSKTISAEAKEKEAKEESKEESKAKKTAAKSASKPKASGAKTTAKASSKSKSTATRKTGTTKGK